MSTPFSGKLILSTAILFALSAIPAFANHGGGGGGGFHGGGGGFHGGGGFRGGSASGGRSYSAPAAGYGSRAYAPSMRSNSGAGYASRPNYSGSRPGSNMAAGGQRVGNGSSVRPGVADGQWHSFGNAPANRGASGEPAGSAAANNGGWHVASGNRAATTPGTVRSFSGQGSEVWENGPASRNVISRTQSLSTIHNSFSGGFAANSASRGGSGFTASSRFASGSLLAHNGFVGGATNSVPQLRGGLGFNGFGGPFGRPFGRPFGGFGGFGRGCWNCGFGLGFGWGGWGWGGWPWLGFGWDPFWADPWWGGPAPPYGYYAYPAYPDSGYYGPDDNYNPPPQQQYEDNGPESYNEGPVNGNWVTPNGPSPSQAANSSEFAVPVLDLHEERIGTTVARLLDD